MLKFQQYRNLSDKRVPVSNIQPNFIPWRQSALGLSVCPSGKFPRIQSVLGLFVCPSGMFPWHKSIHNTNRNEQRWTPNYVTLFCTLYLGKLAVTNGLSNNLVLLLKIPSDVLFLDKKCYTILY